MSLGLALALCVASSPGTSAPSSAGAPLSAGFRLIENQGQWDTTAQYVGRVPSALVRVEPGALGMQLFEGGNPDRGVYTRLEFLGCREDHVLLGEGPGSETYNWIRGKDPAKWVRNALGYQAVRYCELYDGIDLLVHEAGGTAKYDVIVQAGADLSELQVRCQGVEELRLESDGSLAIDTALGSIVQPAPRTWVELGGGQQREVVCRYRMIDERTFGLEVPEGEMAGVLVVDPELLWSTYIGAPTGLGEAASSVAIAPNGDTTVVGVTSDPVFPTTPGAYQSGPQDGSDCFVTQFSGRDGSLIFSSVIGGQSNIDKAFDVELDALGQATVAGETDSIDFPTTFGAFDTVKDSFNGSGYILRLTAQGDDLVYSTLLEGTGGATGIRSLCLTASGAAIGTGSTVSDDFPTTAGAFQEDLLGIRAAVVTRLDPSGAFLEWSTFLSPTAGAAIGRGITVGDSGVVTVVGETSDGFPTTPGSYQPNWVGSVSSKAFVTQMSADGSSLVWSSYLGGGGNGVGGDAAACAVSLAPDGAPIVIGSTSQANFPTTPGAFLQAFPGSPGQFNVFVTRFHPTGSSLAYSTFLGTPFTDAGRDIVIDGSGRAFITGYTSWNTFQVTPDAFDPTWNGSSDIFFSIVARDGKSLDYSTYIGKPNPDEAHGIALSGDRVAIVGTAFGPGYPTTPGSYQPTYQGGQADAVVTTFAFPQVDSGTPSSGAPRTPSAPIILNATAGGDGNVDVVCTGVPAGSVGTLILDTPGRRSRRLQQGGDLEAREAITLVPVRADATGTARATFALPADWPGGAVLLQGVFRPDDGNAKPGSLRSQVETLQIP